MGRRPKTPLTEALEKFGRQGIRLSPSRLEALPVILVALHGEGILSDGTALHEAAMVLEANIRSAIEGMTDSTNRRIAAAMLVADPELEGKTVQQRIEHLTAEYGISSDVYWTRRPEVVREVAAELVGTRIRSLAPAASRSLPLEDRRILGLIYLHAQPVMMIIDAYDFLARCTEAIATDGRCRKTTHVVPSEHTAISDDGLWNNAYCNRYLLRLQEHPKGREFIREHRVPPSEWPLVGVGLPLGVEQQSRLDRALSEGSRDGALWLMDSLSTDEHGEMIKQRWLKFLTDPPPAPDRFAECGPLEISRGHRADCLEELLWLCVTLEGAAPEYSLSARYVHDLYELRVSLLIEHALEESGVERDSGEYTVIKEVVEALDLARPGRYTQEHDGSVDWDLP